MWRHKRRKRIVPPRSWRTADEEYNGQLRIGPRPHYWPNGNEFEVKYFPD